MDIRTLTDFSIITANDAAFGLYSVATPETAEAWEGALRTLKGLLELARQKEEYGKEWFYNTYKYELSTTLLVDPEGAVEGLARKVWAMAVKINRKSAEEGFGYKIPIVDLSAGIVQVVRDLFEL